MLALMFTVSTSFANNETLSLETKNESKSLVFSMDAQKETVIRLMDVDSNVIYSDKVSEATYNKRFNLKNLSNGTYYFTTEDALRKTVYTISVEGSVVKILDKKENPKAVFRTNGRMIYVNLLNTNKEDVKIEVYDSSNRLVFSEKRENEMIIEKAINFQDAYADNYTVVVKDSEDTYYKSISIN